MQSQSDRSERFGFNRGRMDARNARLADLRKNAVKTGDDYMAFGMNSSSSGFVRAGSRFRRPSRH